MEVIIMFSSILSGSLSAGSFFLCMGAAALLGVLGALVNMYKNRHTESFSMALALIPMAVAMVIMLVNGTIGAGVAVAGSFALVRFRSAPGTGREIAAIFSAMAVGLAVGMGYIWAAALFFLCYAALTMGLTCLSFGGKDRRRWTLRITVPENADYSVLFDDIFDANQAQAELVRVKTASMGTLFELTYEITLPDPKNSRRLLDELRVRNGNLSICLSPAGEMNKEAL